MTDYCGDHGGQNDDNEPCGRVAGWGTEWPTGPCRDHAEQYRVPRKLDEETKSQLVGAAQRGAFKKHCAQIAGITPRTLRNWLSQGEEHAENDLDTPLAEFYFRFQQARAAGAAERLSEASPEFVLSASYGYTKAERREYTGEGGGALEVVINDSIREANEP